MQSYPKISIITPTFNASKTLKNCIESVANQTYSNFEHWIVDGLSTDSTMEIVKEYAEKYPHIKYISEKDSGIYNAMNKGIKNSQGEWLYFLGADDELYDENVLENIFRSKNWGDYTSIYGDFFDARNEKIVSYQNIELNKFFFVEQSICHQVVFTKKVIFDKIGYFDEQFKICADRKFSYDYFNSNEAKYCHISLVVAKYAGTGISSKTNYPEVSNILKHIFANLTKEEYLVAKVKLSLLVDMWLSNVLFYGEDVLMVFKALYINGNIGMEILTQKLLNPMFWLTKSSKVGAFTNIEKGSVLIGIVQVFFLIFRERRFFYYIKNTLYWLKKRISSPITPHLPTE